MPRNHHLLDFETSWSKKSNERKESARICGKQTRKFHPLITAPNITGVKPTPNNHNDTNKKPPFSNSQIESSSSVGFGVKSDEILPSSGMYIYTYVCVYLYSYIHMCLYVHICICILIYLYKCKHICIYLYICIYMCRYTYTYLCIYIHIYIHINMYIYIQYIYKYIHIHIYHLQLIL
jgi:hypothetical protein